jgi:hypothetical protein
MGQNIIPEEYSKGDRNLLKWLIEMEEPVQISKDAKAIVLKDQNFFRNFAES